MLLKMSLSMQPIAATEGREQVNPCPHSTWGKAEELTAQDPCCYSPSQPVRSILLGHLKLERQQSAEREAGRDVLREALQELSRQTNNRIACPGLFISQTQLLESGEDAVSSTAPSASFLTVSADTAFPPMSRMYVVMSAGRDPVPKRWEGPCRDKATMKHAGKNEVS